jgi:multidrug efflux pump subunit AcrB
MTDLVNTPLLTAGSPGATTPVTLLSNVATLKRHGSQTVATHSNTLPSFDVYANIQDRDLGSIESDLKPLIAHAQQQLKPGNSIELRGQINAKDASFTRLGLGLIAAMVFVYLLMVVNFQTWGEPFVVLAALPLAFCGIIAALFVTGTTLSIPSLFGAIMSVGIASANSILLVTFAKEYRERTGCSAAEAAIAAGETRLRPVLMTAGAMFVGLIPMALGLGDGSEQNAALARAVMGGVLVGTCSTLLLVPLLYGIFRRNTHGKPVEDYV